MNALAKLKQDYYGHHEEMNYRLIQVQCDVNDLVNNSMNLCRSLFNCGFLDSLEGEANNFYTEARNTGYILHNTSLRQSEKKPAELNTYTVFRNSYYPSLSAQE